MPVVDSSAARLTYALVGSLVLHAGLWIGLPVGKGAVLGAGGQGTTLELKLRSAPASVARDVAPVGPPKAIVAAAATLPSSNIDTRVTKASAQARTVVLEQPASQETQPDTASIANIDPTPSTAAIVPTTFDGTIDETDLASGLYYFAASELDVRAAPQGAIYPEAPKGSEEQAGYLVLRLLISELGGVDRVDVLISEPEGVFDAAAAASFSRAQFYPAMRQGFPVKSRMMVELKIEPDFALLSQSANSRQLLHTENP